MNNSLQEHIRKINEAREQMRSTRSIKRKRDLARYIRRLNCEMSEFLKYMREAKR